MLSAISSAGSEIRASTIIARCIIPPEYWNGYSLKRRSAAGILTAFSNWIALSRALPAEMPGRTARSFSTSWAPTVMVGSSAPAGLPPT